MKVVHEKNSNNNNNNKNNVTGILCFKKYEYSFYSSKFLLIRLGTVGRWDVSAGGIITRIIKCVSERGGLIRGWVCAPEFTICISWKKQLQKQFLIEYLKFAGISLVEFILV